MANAPTAQQIAANNAAIRGMILANGVARLQQIFATGISPSAQNGPINVPIQNVGLIRGFLVKVQGTFTNAAGSTATRTEFGAANLLSAIAFQDFNNITRIQTTGWHMNLLNSAKNNMVFGGAYAPNVPSDYGNNWTVQSAPATIAASTDAPFTFFYYVPLAYAKNDLRGAVYAGLVGATAQLQLTLNPTPFAAAGDATLAVYSGNAGNYKAAQNVNITVYQDYIDQLPTMNGQVLLPQVDLSTIYDIKNTSSSGLVVGQDFGVLFANFRTFLSTAIVYDNGGTLNTGSDINYFSLTAANSANLWKYTPDVAALLARGQFMADPPKGTYFFDTRQAPINTQQYGNMEIIVNPSVVNAGASLLVGYESFAMTQTITGAASLPSG
jgi:hypothetical protein